MNQKAKHIILTTLASTLLILGIIILTLLTHIYLKQTFPQATP